MISASQEDYLKIIYTTNVSKKKITNKYISERLGISPPSVSEMINKLIDNQNLKKDDLLGYVLTDRGTKRAQNLIRKHRLWEVFLVDYLGFDWDEVHDDAEVLEHATSDHLADQLSKFLEFPITCPHGSIIYGNSEVVNHFLKQIVVEDLNIGESGIVCEVSDEKKFLNYIKAKGLKINDFIEIVDIDDYDGTRVIKVNNHLIEISALACSEMSVRRN